MKSKTALVLKLAMLVALLLALVFGAPPVLALGNLGVTFTSGPPSSVTAGTGDYTFAVKVTNKSWKSPALSVVFEYRVPTGVVITGIQSTAGPCQVGTEGDPNDPATCQLGHILPRASKTVDVTFSVRPACRTGPSWTTTCRRSSLESSTILPTMRPTLSPGSRPGPIWTFSN